jgi:hypothetical protein
MTRQSKKVRKAREFYVILDSDGSTWGVSKRRKALSETIDEFNWGALGCKIIKVREVIPANRSKKK